uniref:Calcineurin-like phosphoesterase domain-containing protein n=1 Tax=viral metagenome TaxID=1070528 RepID=A0A6M3L9H7_9ZZZZ
MGGPKLSPDEWQQLFKERRNGTPIAELAQAYHLSGKYLANKLSLEGVVLGIASSDKPRYDKPPKFPPDCLILCDSHIPYHDAKFINKALVLAQNWKLPNLLLAGDVMDMAALSFFSHKPTEILSKELDAGENFFKSVGEIFERILMLMGNHERRFLHYLREQLGMKYLMRLLDERKAVVSEYSYAFVEDWLVGHPRNASVIPGRVPVFLSRKYPRFNVASGHGHLAGMAYCEDGERLAIDIGCSVDPKRLDWISENLGTRPALAQGALILKKTERGVVPWWLHPKSDFEAMRRMY